MYRPISLLMAVTLYLAVTFGQAADPARTPSAENTDAVGDAAAIRQIEDEGLKAERTTNAEVLDRTMAADFIGIGADGFTSGKAQLLKNWQAHAGQAPPYSVGISDMHIVVRGGIAVVAYTKTYTAKENGNVMHEDKTDVFTKDHTEWKLRVSRSSFREHI